MYDIHMAEITRDFAECWRAGGLRLDRQVQGGIRFWLKAELVPPFLEHLSFRLGNHLFFVQLVDADERVAMPGSPDGLRSIAHECKGHACLMPMLRKRGGWEPAEPGWGLVDLDTGKAVDPLALVDDTPVPMTQWELHDFAVQVVRQHLEAEGHELMSWQGSPHVDPSLWFVGPEGPEWVVVRAVAYPAGDAGRPSNLAAIAAHIGDQAVRGNFASVAIANSLDLDGAPLRGGPMRVRFLGLEDV